MRNIESKLDGLARRAYEQLEPADRVRLIIEQHAKGSHDEALRIMKAAPVSSYRTGDPRFNERIRALWQMVRDFLAHMGRAGKQLRTMQMLEAECLKAQVVVLSEWDDMRGGGRDAESASDGPPYRRAEELFRAHEVAFERLREAFYVWGSLPVLLDAHCRWRAFDGCCRKHFQIDGRTVVQAYGERNHLKQVDLLEQMLAEHEVDAGAEGLQELIDAYTAQLEKVFQFIPKEDE